MRVKYNIDTKLVYQIGYPMHQGCASILHNAMFDYANVNAVCLALEVPKGGLGPFIEAAKTMGIEGFDITMPHKTDIIPFLDECDEASRAFRCVNHVKIRNGKLIGIGLDGVGMGMSIAHKAKGELRGRHALIIGAGAVAGPIAADLCTRGIREVTIVNRTVEKAEYIAKTLHDLYGVETHYGPMAPEVLDEVAPKIGLVVQCTSLGGNYAKGNIYLGFVSKLPADCIAADVLFPTTSFLEEAKRNHLQTINGEGMMYYQELALIDFRFGIKMPFEAMDEAEEALKIGIAVRDMRNELLRRKEQK